MTRLAVIALLLAIIVVLFRSFFRADGGGETQATEMVQDPNCKTFIPRPEAIRQTVGGRELYFCSQKCADEYRLKS